MRWKTGSPPLAWGIRNWGGLQNWLERRAPIGVASANRSAGLPVFLDRIRKCAKTGTPTHTNKSAGRGCKLVSEDTTPHTGASPLFKDRSCTIRANCAPNIVRMSTLHPLTLRKPA